MQRYTILLTQEASKDIDDIYHYIACEVMSPLTASRYVEGILEKIDSLVRTAGIYALNQREYLCLLYGRNVRTVTYKKLTIVYHLIDDVVLIRRVMPSSLIR